MTVDPSKLFQRFRAALSASQGHNPGGQETKMPGKPTMRVAVRRFQGIYECGCKVPDPSPEAPPLCEIHELPFKYLVEVVGTFDAEGKVE
jgi:hypothetical protein